MWYLAEFGHFWPNLVIFWPNLLTRSGVEWSGIEVVLEVEHIYWFVNTPTAFSHTDLESSHFMILTTEQKLTWKVRANEKWRSRNKSALNMKHIDVSNLSLATLKVEIFRFVIRTTGLKDPVFLLISKTQDGIKTGLLLKRIVFIWAQLLNELS